MADTQTARKLEAITDEGLFERLAMAVLRASSPVYYFLLHQGVNADGKTIKSPVDGFAFVPGANPPHMLAAHHTTCKKADLAAKWLHEPMTVKARKIKPTATEGDALKAAKIYGREKKRHKSLVATLVLTTNREPSYELVSDVHAFARAAGIAIDIWSRSRIAEFLDNDPTGQWLRKKYLGIDQVRISKELLVDLSQMSIRQRRMHDAPNWIQRELDDRLSQFDGDVLFVAAGSGFGKSVACFKNLSSHVQNGGFGLVIPHDAVADAITIYQAIDIALHQLHPTLEADAAGRIGQYLSPDNPLLLVVEDVNHSGRAALLLEKLSGWSEKSNQSQASSVWRLFCPVWPQILTGLTDTARQGIESRTMVAGGFSPEEGTRAVSQRFSSLNLPVSSSKAAALSAALGHDPLLIGLHDPDASSEPDNVIPNFIESSLHRLVADRNEYTAADYRGALMTLACAMLEHREVDPLWSALQTWPEIGSEALAALRHIVHHAEVLHLAGASYEQRLAFRHDRVRERVLADAAAMMLRSEPSLPGVLCVPYYAEFVGLALARYNVPIERISEIQASNPLALFHSIRHFREPTNAIHESVVAAAKQLVTDSVLHDREHLSLRREAVHALSQIESSLVLDLINGIRERGWADSEARFRNGDMAGGISLCASIEPGVHVPWHEELIAHVVARFGSNLRTRLEEILRRRDLPPLFRVGAIRLAGHIGSASLEEGLRVSWDIDSDRTAHLADYLWASAQCYGDEPALLLGPVCDAWAALPDTPLVENMPSPRADLAAESVRWAFGRKPPLSAIPYFVERAKTEDLRFPITYMLHGVDEPSAVEHVARELAAGEERLHGTGGIWPFSMIAGGDWQRRQRDKGREMSPQSRSRLFQLWHNQSSGKFLRREAFKLWSATRLSSDIAILQTIENDDELTDEVLVERLVRADLSAIPKLIEKIESNRNKTTHWWRFGCSVWSDELTQLLERELTRRGNTVSAEWSLNEGYETDWITSELVMRLPVRTAEHLLVRHWDHLKWSHYFIKAALYVATPELKSMVASVMVDCPEPKEALKFLSSKFGIKVVDHPGVTRSEQLDALVPYLVHLEEIDIMFLGDLCNERGWFEYRRKHLDHRNMMNAWQSVYTSKAKIFQSLDEMLREQRLSSIDHWVDNYHKTGASIDEIMDAIRTWLSVQTSIDAFELAAAAIVHIGHRRHLAILQCKQFEPKDQARAIAKDAGYAVGRRTLS